MLTTRIFLSLKVSDLLLNIKRMNSEFFLISKTAFNELCKYICWQIQPSGSGQLDRETINFAIYWQICFVLGQKMEPLIGLASKNDTYQRLVQEALDLRMTEPFNVSEIVDQNISELFRKQYQSDDGFSLEQKESSAIFFKNFTLA